MAIGTGLFLAALGAILIWAVEDNLEAINLEVAGIVVLILGAATALAALLTGHTDETERRR